MDIRAAAAALNYSNARDIARPQLGSEAQGAGTPANAFAEVAQDFHATLQKSEDISKQAMTTGVDPHALVQALAETELALEAAVTVRDRVVEAYQEILRMPI